MRSFIILYILLLLSPMIVMAGTLDSPASPTGSGSAMYGLKNIYDRLDTGAAGAKRTTTFTEPPSGSITSTGHTLNEVMAKAPLVDNTNGAVTTDVLTGKTFWGLTSGTWGFRTGTVPVGNNINGGDGLKSFTILDGLYSGNKTATAYDSDLLQSNIKLGIEIFGVTGSYSGTASCIGDALSNDVLSGKTFSNSSDTGLTGNIPTKTLSDTSINVSAGYYIGTNLTAVDADLAVGNIKDGITIFGITGNYTGATSCNGNAVIADVLSGKTFSNGTTTGLIGTMPTQTLNNTNDTVSAGYYAGTTLAAVDTDLISDNIKSGKNIFGVAGNSNVVDTNSGDAVASEILTGKKAWVDGVEITGTVGFGAGVAKTGQTKCYKADGTEINPCPSSSDIFYGQDGNFTKGVAWPNPRFTDNGDGTVTDGLTGLIWLKNANVAVDSRSWTDALNDIVSLNSNGRMNGNDAGNTSNKTDWRLPNINELLSLVDRTKFGPAFSDPNLIFSNMSNSNCWSSTTYISDTNRAWIVSFNSGYVTASNKDSACRVWAVRGGE